MLAKKLKLLKFIDSLWFHNRAYFKKCEPKTFKEAILKAKNIEWAPDDEQVECNDISNENINQIIIQQLIINRKILELSEKYTLSGKVHKQNWKKVKWNITM